MKPIIRTLPFLILAVLPPALSAQVVVPLGRLSRPAVRANLGPISVVATLGRDGVTVRAGRRPSRGTPGTARRTPARLPRTPAATATAARVLATADRYVGIRYTYGGSSPAAGFDCSGLVQYVFARHGVSLPRTSRQQATAGRALPRRLAALRPGDLMLFASRGRRVDHVAIYAGEGRILHSSKGGGGVRYDDLSSPRGEWYLARHVASRRVLR